MPEIVDEILSDPERGSERLVAEYGDRLFNVGCRLCFNEKDAEDLVFRTLARAIEKIATFKGKSSFFSWVYQIMVNLRRMDVRLKAANALVFLPETPEQEDERPDPAELLSRATDAELVRQAVAMLPHHLREVMVFRYYEDMALTDIAEVLGIPAGTARFRLHYAKKLLRKQLQTFHKNESSNVRECNE